MSRETKPDEIVVSVRGRAGVGKSALVRLISEALEAAGISHHAYDDGEKPAEARALQSARVQSLRQRVHVKIKTRSPAKSSTIA